VIKFPASGKTPIVESEAPQLLIADDDPGIVRFLATRCTAMGFRVQTTVNGLNALLLAARIRPEVLIVDINMPEVDGLTVSDRLMHSDKKPNGMIVITASWDPDNAQRCQKSGAHYVRKGVDLWTGVHAALVRMFPDMSFDDAAAISASRPELRRTRILLVDGYRGAGKLLCSRLNRYCIETLIAIDASEGLRIAISSEPTVIILEVPMLLGDPYYLISQLRANPKTDRTPIFVTSPRLLDETTKANLRREILGHPGATHFFLRSPAYEDLFEALQKYCAFPTDRDARSISVAAAG
jgi:CheY-like chemotaxis protein